MTPSTSALNTPGRPTDCGPVRSIYYETMETYPSDARVRFPFGPCIDMPFGLPPFALGGDVIEPEQWAEEDRSLAAQLACLGISWKLLEERLEAAFCKASRLGFALPGAAAQLRGAQGPRGPAPPRQDDSRPVQWCVFPDRNAARGVFYTLPTLPDSWILSDQHGNCRPNSLRIWYWLLPDVQTRVAPSHEASALARRKKLGDADAYERPHFSTRLEELRNSIRIAGQVLGNREARWLLGIRDDERFQELLSNWVWAQHFYGRVPAEPAQRKKEAAKLRANRKKALEQCANAEDRDRLAHALEPGRIEQDVNQLLGDPKASSSGREILLGAHPALRGSRVLKTGFVVPLARAAHRALWQALPANLPLDDLPAGLRRMVEIKGESNPKDLGEPTTFNVAGEWDNLIACILNHIPLLFGARTYHELDGDAARQARRAEQTTA